MKESFFIVKKLEHKQKPFRNLKFTYKNGHILVLSGQKVKLTKTNSKSKKAVYYCTIWW